MIVHPARSEFSLDDSVGTPLSEAVAEYLCSHITVHCFLPVYSLPTFCRSLLSHPASLTRQCAISPAASHVKDVLLRHAVQPSLALTPIPKHSKPSPALQGFVYYHPTQSDVSIQLPSSSSEICRGCGHPWISHESRPCNDSTHTNFHFRKGGYPTNDCGGFYAVCSTHPSLFLRSQHPTHRTLQIGHTSRSASVWRSGSATFPLKKRPAEPPHECFHFSVFLFAF